ncbi:MAG: cadmium resistance transporter [Pseudomonadales bacterium]
METISIETLGLIGLVGLVVSAFVATNLDNLLILVVLLGANTRQRSMVLLGFVCSTLAVMSVSVIGVVVGSVLQAGLIGYMGLVPLLLGCYMLYKSWTGVEHPDVADDALANRSGAGVWLGSFGLLFSNSGDSVVVFLPLLADSGLSSVPFILCSYLACSLLFAGLANLIAGRRELALLIEQRAEKIVPWIMIAVGTYILLNTATDRLS